MNRTDLDRMIYGESFELDGRRIDPRDVILKRDSTWSIREWNMHSGVGMPSRVTPKDRVEVEYRNGERGCTIAARVCWFWALDFTPGDNYGRHMPGNVMRWRKVDHPLRLCFGRPQGMVDPRDVILKRDCTWYVRQWNEHDGNGMPASVKPDDWVEIEIPNGNRVQCFAEYAGWTWLFDFTPGDNYGGHTPGNVMRWRKP